MSRCRGPGWVSEVSLVSGLCAKVLLVSGAASLPHLGVLWHVCEWVGPDDVPVNTKATLLSVDSSPGSSVYWHIKLRHIKGSQLYMKGNDPEDTLNHSFLLVDTSTEDQVAVMVRHVCMKSLQLYTTSYFFFTELQDSIYSVVYYDLFSNESFAKI